MNKLWHVLLGRGKHDDEIIAEGSMRAHAIKNQMQEDLGNIMNEIKEVNRASTERLGEVNKKLGLISQQIAIATGAKKRGYE